MTGSELRLVAVGDVHPNRNTSPNTLFELAEPDLNWGDIRYCQLECTISDRGHVRSDVRNPTHRVAPHNIKALTSASFDVVSYAGNNNLDYGVEAFTDTLDRLRDHGIQVVGAGLNLKEARRPLYIDVNGIRVAFVDFCSILRDGYAATPGRPGISPLRVKTFYEPLENIYEQPGTPARTITMTDRDDLDAAMTIIRTARSRADVVVACFHWGVHFTYDLAQYQPEVGYAAIEAGADLVLGTHPHCLQAIDVYKGKFIFYSLGNFAFEQPQQEAQQGVADYLSFYGIPVEKDLPQHPHPKHTRMSAIVKVLIRDKRISEVTVIPTYFNDDAQPEPLEPTMPMRSRVVGLLRDLCAEVGTSFTERDRELVLHSSKSQPMDTRIHLHRRKLSYPWLQRLSAETQ